MDMLLDRMQIDCIISRILVKPEAEKGSEWEFFGDATNVFSVGQKILGIGI